MSKEYLEQFLEQVGSDEELKAQIEDQLDSDGNIPIDVLIALGVEFGCEFDIEDLWNSEELRGAELDGDGVVATYDDGITVSNRWKDVNLRFEKDRIGIPDECETDCNKNGIPFDTQKMTITSGIRLGTQAATTRGFELNEFKMVI